MKSKLSSESEVSVQHVIIDGLIASTYQRQEGNLSFQTYWRVIEIRPQCCLCLLLNIPVEISAYLQICLHPNTWALNANFPYVTAMRNPDLNKALGINFVSV